jgi:Fe-S oxidoreductase
MKPQVDRQTHEMLDNIVAECSGCGSCYENCDVLPKISPTTPGNVARQVLNGQIDENIRKYLLRCALCGLCVNSCPKSLDKPQMVIAARRLMVETGITDPDIYRIMWIDHDWNAITLFRNTYQLNFDSLVKENCYTLFMPGCSLANEAPQLVYTTIDWLNGQGGGKAGVILMCCGMPLLEMGLTERAERYERSFWQKVTESLCWN